MTDAEKAKAKEEAELLAEIEAEDEEREARRFRRRCFWGDTLGVLFCVGVLGMGAAAIAWEAHLDKVRDLKSALTVCEGRLVTEWSK